MLPVYLVICPFHPQSIGLTPDFLHKYPRCCIMTTNTYAPYFTPPSKQLVILPEISEQTVLHYVQSHPNLIIEQAISLAEEFIELGGIINNLFAQNTLQQAQEVLAARCYRNKYLMRCRLQATTISQPTFTIIQHEAELYHFAHVNQLRHVVLKPLSANSAAGVQVIDTAMQTLQKLCLPLLAEAHIPHQKMYTTDGIFQGDQLLAFYIHEYETPLLSSLAEVKRNVTRSTSLPWGSALHHSLFYQTKVVLKQFNTLHTVMPFHIEWFLDENGTLVFCEAASRFGGRIASVIQAATGHNLLALFWRIIFEQYQPPFLTYDDCLLPAKIGFNYFAYRRAGQVQLTEQDKIPAAHYYVSHGQQLTPATDVSQLLFTITSSAEQLIDYRQQIKSLDQHMKEIIITKEL